MKRSILLLLVIFVTLLSSCSSKQVTSQSALPGKEIKIDNGSYRDITVSELQAMLKNKDFTLVNVHTPFEGNLPGTDVSIPYDQITMNLDKLPPGKDAKLVLYCRSGRMSQIAAADLARLGYTNVYELVGGMVAWEQAGLTIEH